MAGRRWTVMIVPHGSDSPRSLPVPERLVRALPWIVGLTLLCLLGVGATVSHLAAPYVVPAVRQEVASTQELAELRVRVSELHDTLLSVTKRDEQLRLYAGLPAADSAAQAAGLAPPAVLPADRDDKHTSFLGRTENDPSTDVDGMIRRANSLSASFDEISEALAKNVQRMASTPSIMPTAGWLSSEFTRYRFHPILHVGRPHEGIDVAAPMGAPVVAPASGTVSVITRQTGYGLVLEIDHGNGLETKYAHLSRVNVRAGQRVTRGQLIANVGNSGLSTGPHLHYEIHVNGKVVDPLTYVLPDAIPD